MRKAEITAGCKQLKGRNKGKGENLCAGRNNKTKANLGANLFSPKVDILRKLQERQGSCRPLEVVVQKFMKVKWN